MPKAYIKTSTTPLQDLRRIIPFLEDISLRKYIRTKILAKQPEQELPITAESENYALYQIRKNFEEIPANKAELTTKVQDALKFFYEYKPLFNNDGRPRMALDPTNSAIGRYLVEVIPNDEDEPYSANHAKLREFQTLMKFICEAMYLASLDKNKAKRETFFHSYNLPRSELVCVEGANARIESAILNLNANVDNALFVNAHQATLSTLSEKTWPFIHEGNQVHAPRYLELILSLRDEEEIKKIDANYLTPKPDVPSKIVIEIVQNYSAKIKNYLLKSLEEKELISQVTQEVSDYLASEVTENNLGNNNYVFTQKFDLSDIEQEIKTGEIELNYKRIENIETQLTDHYPALKTAVAEGKIDLVTSDLHHYFFNKEKIAEVILQDRLKKQLNALTPFLPTKPIFNYPKISPQMAFSQDIIPAIKEKLELRNEPQQALEAIEILLALSSQCKGNAVEHFVKIVDEVDQLLSQTTIEAEHLWKIDEIYDRKEIIAETLADYENQIGDDDKHNLLHKLSIGSTEQVLEFIQQNQNDLSQILAPYDGIYFNINGNTAYAEIIDSIVTRGDFDIILSRLLATNQDITDFLEQTLFSLLKQNRVEDFKKLLAHEKITSNILSSTDPINGNTILHFAILNNSKEIIAELITSDKITSEIIAIKNANGFTALDAASFNGHNETVEKFLASDKITHEIMASKDIWGYTALNTAAMQGHDEITQLLLTKGSALFKHEPLKTFFDKKHSAINSARLEGKVEFATKLEEIQRKQKMLHNAIKKGLLTTNWLRENITENNGVAISPLEISSILNSRDRNDFNAVLHAIKKRDAQALQILLDNGANIYLPSPPDKQFFSSALKSQDAESIKVLLQHDIDKNSNKFIKEMMGAFIANPQLIAAVVESIATTATPTTITKLRDNFHEWTNAHLRLNPKIIAPLLDISKNLREPDNTNANEEISLPRRSRWSWRNNQIQPVSTLSIREQIIQNLTSNSPQVNIDATVASSSSGTRRLITVRSASNIDRENGHNDNQPRVGGH